MFRYLFAFAAILLFTANACDRPDERTLVAAGTRIEGTWLLSSEYGGWGHTAAYTDANTPERITLTAADLKVERRDSLGTWRSIAETPYSITSSTPDVDSAQLTVYTLDLPKLGEGTVGGRYEQFWLEGDRLQRDRNAPAYDGTAYTYSRVLE